MLTLFSNISRKKRRSIFPALSFSYRQKLSRVFGWKSVATDPKLRHTSTLCTSDQIASAIISLLYPLNCKAQRSYNCVSSSNVSGKRMWIVCNIRWDCIWRRFELHSNTYGTTLSKGWGRSNLLHPKVFTTNTLRMTLILFHRSYWACILTVKHTTALQFHKSSPAVPYASLTSNSFQITKQAAGAPERCHRHLSP